MRQYTHDKEAWIKANPTVDEWHRKLATKAKGTADVYSSQLWKYWKESLSKLYATIEQWRKEVKTQLKSDEVSISRKWARDLEKYLPTTQLRKGSRFVLVQSVKSYLKRDMDLPETEVELESRDMPEEYEYPPLKPEELQALVNKASTRDKAVILSQITAGFGIGELVKFTREWKTYLKDIQNKTVPLKVMMKRPKTKVKYWSLLWHDAVDALNGLLLEKVRETGTIPETLFATQYDKQIDEDDVSTTVRFLANTSRLEPSREGVRVYRIRPHAFRHYFKTTCTENGVDAIVSEFCLGHGGKEIARVYDEFMETEKGKARIIKEMEKAAPWLNVVTGRGRPVISENDVKAKVMREVYNGLIKSKKLRPEDLTPDVLETICKACGIEVASLVQFKNPDATSKALAYFEILAETIGLDKQTTDQYLQAIEVVKPTPATTSWENHVNWWIRCEVGTDDYMKALADGFLVEDKDDKMRILRKPKPKS